MTDKLFARVPSRTGQWTVFQNKVWRHINEYANVQYGNREGEDQVTDWSAEDCFKAIEKYINRRRTSVRGNKERLRDLFKIAHYAQLAYDKLRDELNEPDVYEANDAD